MLRVKSEKRNEECEAEEAIAGLCSNFLIVGEDETEQRKKEWNWWPEHILFKEPAKKVYLLQSGKKRFPDSWTDFYLGASFFLIISTSLPSIWNAFANTSSAILGTEVNNVAAID